MLSQDEIDALLKGTSVDKETPAETKVEDVLKNEDYFNAMEEDAIGEIGNISFGNSATALSTLLQQKVEITTPSVSVIQKSKLGDEFQQPYVAIEVNYTAGFTGSNLLVIKQSDAAIIADLMIGGDGTNPDEMLGDIQISAVQEAMNQMMGSAATSMSTIFNKKVDISPPRVELLEAHATEGTKSIVDEDLLAKVSFRLKIGTLIDSNIMQLLPLLFAKDLINELMNPTQEAVVEPSNVVRKSEEPAMKDPHIQMNDRQREADHIQQQQYMEQSGQQMYTVPQPTKQQPTVDVKPAEFATFEQAPYQQQEMQNLDMLLDVPLQVTVELGRTKVC